jgi:four helix bundle protein
MSGARKFTELAAWQRGYELMVICQELLERPAISRDARFRTQLADASSSIPRNVAEGFGRFRPGENAQYVRVAKGSAQEVMSLLLEARKKGYVSQAEFPRLETAANRSIGTLVRYVQYLERAKADDRWK